MPWITGGAILGGALLSNMAAGDAADAQSQASAAAIAEQRRQFDILQKNQAPWLNVGSNAVYRLGELLGLGLAPGTPGSMNAADVRARLLPHFTSGSDTVENGQAFQDDRYGNNTMYRYSDGTVSENPTRDVSNSVVNEEALQKAIQARMARERATPKPDDYGSLLQDFGRQDFQKDPGYRFRLDQGSQAIDRAAKARGMYMSPSTVKELLRYNQGFASNEYTNAYNRDMANRTSKFNMLSGVSGGGQTAANQVGNAGMNMAGTVGNLITGAANARGAAGIAGANAWGNAANTIGNWYQQNQMLNRMFPQVSNYGALYNASYGPGGDQLYG